MKIDWVIAVSDITAASDRDGSLDVGPGGVLRRLRPRFQCWPLLTAVATDERREHFQDRRVVSARVASDAPEGVYAADPDAELVRAELVNRLRAAVGHLPLAGQLERLPRQLDRVSRQDEVRSGEDQGANGEQPSGESVAASARLTSSTRRQPSTLTAADSQR